ncbi:MAG: primosomal protein, partial [Massilia sp.]|nr:primosomal protein [Massilia sp.]
MAYCILTVALDTPLNSLFDYRWPCESGAEPLPGQLALVSFGRREVVGLIVTVGRETDVPPEKLKDALAVRSQLGPLSSAWLALATFAADYYQRPLGEVALPGLPKNLRVLTTVALDRALKKLAKPGAAPDSTAVDTPLLNPAQQVAADAIGGAAGFTPILLYGVTGSGKTEVYLQACAQVLARDPQAQILILVPEINLTPQLEGNIRARFPGLMLATLHSSLSEGERMLHWLAAHQGQARIILGTRLSILASLPHLQLIVIDEEHDPSYKQQEGLRYSARDLAVWRARQLGIPIVLGSATPSLESWHHAGSGRYRKLELRERAVTDAVLPRVKLLDMEKDRPKDGLTSHLVAALRQRMERGEQSLLFLNRRGYAPVINCEACGWISECTRCTAHMVLHKPEHRLRCHHCSLDLRIPRNCPTCGNVDLQPMGRGTQRVEEGLQQMFPEARILRIDAD